MYVFFFHSMPILCKRAICTVLYVYERGFMEVPRADILHFTALLPLLNILLSTIQHNITLYKNQLIKKYFRTLKEIQLVIFLIL